VNEKAKAEAVTGAGSLQRKEGSVEEVKADLRKKIRSIREGHGTGGYCDTEALKAEEKKLHHVLSVEIEEAEAKHDHQSQAIATANKRELAGLSYRPKLVVAED